jgi:hypothetical protein
MPELTQDDYGDAFVAGDPLSLLAAYLLGHATTTCFARCRLCRAAYALLVAHGVTVDAIDRLDRFWGTP